MRDEYQGAFWAENHGLWSDSASAAWRWLADLPGVLGAVRGVSRQSEPACGHKEG